MQAFLSAERQEEAPPLVSLGSQELQTASSFSVSTLMEPLLPAGVAMYMSSQPAEALTEEETKVQSGGSELPNENLFQGEAEPSQPQSPPGSCPEVYQKSAMLPWINKYPQACLTVIDSELL